MNDATILRSGPTVEAIFETLTAEDAPKLSALACVADSAQRRARFGAALDAAAIRRHYESLDWRRYLAVGAFVRRRMESAIEFYLVDARRAEIAALGGGRVAQRLGEGLAAAAAHEARRRGLTELIWIEPDPGDPWRSALLSLGTPSAQGDHIVIRL